MSSTYQPKDAAENAYSEERTPSYSDIHHITNTTFDPGHGRPQIHDLEPPYSAVAQTTEDVITISSQQPHFGYQPPQCRLFQNPHQLPPVNLSVPDSYTTAWGLIAALELESDTIEIYDRSNDSFQYSLKGSISLDWVSESEILLKDARIDFMGYADTVVLRYESGIEGSSLTTETPVHHTHDYIPTPLVLGPPPIHAPSSSTDVLVGTSADKGLEMTISASKPQADAGTEIIAETRTEVEIRAGREVGTGTGTGITTGSARTTAATASNKTQSKHHESLPIDLTLPGHLPDSTDLAIGKIRYELQASLEITIAQGTADALTERFILRRPVLIHRIVYPSSYLQPRVVQGLDSGGVEIQIKVPRLLHCENTLLAVELYAKPRTRNVKLRKAKVVFEQIETDRYQRTSSPQISIPKAIVPLASPATPTHPSASATSPPWGYARSPVPEPAPSTSGPPPAPRLLTRAIAQPLEVEFEEPTSELQTQNLNFQLVLSPDLCVDVQSNWIQISHTVRVEVEYTADDESYIVVPPSIAPSEEQQEPAPQEREQRQDEQQLSQEEQQLQMSQLAIEYQQQQQQHSLPSLWDQEGDAIETDGTESIAHIESESEADLELEQPVWKLDEKKMFTDGDDTGSSTTQVYTDISPVVQDSGQPLDLPPPPSLLSRPKNLVHLSALSTGSASSSYTCSVATEEIPVRVVRVVSTALVDASTLAQAAGETEAGLPTYESVIEATGLPAYAEEKLEDDHEEAEASGTATGVLGGAARRLEGEDAEIERR
ncbi:hypothetical protein BX616_006601 [Lobosporangium transversale]|uniref:Uncharacterized protein n=1 Tax=Lobosporangium transversale TaxID=64571 RepID=A0A1Y2GUD7_9FUNG|nr:hypothetical protein BCR41DRAFT_421635 [Lobosporangium transversale]KAF9915238.1 hypothetical protein BX616_006601 [Lobosporangium transversale]ORZ18414.1 hypothetical protein BCR41DRAFT_421635 [Lobosporangium transversale]|eukprot:XP_021882209.1 hypothetical protein BCR41DRAFT_421635 [Lobosporangium transversale]